MNRHLWLLAIAQGLFLTNNVVFIAINGLVGLSLAPVGWMATLPVMGYVVGGALSTGLVARSQARWGRQMAFQMGLAVAFASALLAAWAVAHGNFWLLVAATVVAGYYSANGQLYRFAAGELAAPAEREKAVSLVLAGGLLGAIAGPNLANHARDWLATPFLGAYLALAAVALVSMVVMAGIRFPADPPPAPGTARAGRSVLELLRQPTFAVAFVGAALGYGVMNLLMAATPLAMQTCGMPFADAAFVLEWHVIGMFAPGFFTGHLIRRFGAITIMGVGVLLNAACIAIALSGQDLHHFTVALFLLGVGWNFLFTGSTTLAMQAYRPEEKDRAQAVINFGVFATMAVTAFASGALVTTQGWWWLNVGSLVPVSITALSLLALAARQRVRASEPAQGA
ncbi:MULTISPECIES: MFS transporter [unclassified Tepidimonas]|uniref:MFS transporter n=1 Tax=unclassified Tepidimonas TaxID=2631705 RepID=UPI003C7D3662